MLSKWSRYIMWGSLALSAMFTIATWPSAPNLQWAAAFFFGIYFTYLVHGFYRSRTLGRRRGTDRDGIVICAADEHVWKDQGRGWLQCTTCHHLYRYHEGELLHVDTIFERGLM